MGEVAATMPPNLHPQAYITAIARKYDLQGVFYLDLWPAADSMVIVTAPELMDYVHVKLPQAQHPFLNDFVAPIVGRDAIVAANGGTWKKLHNAMVPAFSPSHIRNLTSVVVDEMLLFRAKLETFSQSGDVFSMEEVAGKLMFDIAARITFNFSLNAQTHSSDYWDNLQEIVTLTETQFSWNPLRHIRTFFRRKVIEDRLYPSLVKKINERFALLKAEKVLPSRRDPLSILDLMLREDMVNEMDDIPKEYRRVLVSKLVSIFLK
jgi:cytochrome P450